MRKYFELKKVKIGHMEVYEMLLKYSVKHCLCYKTKESQINGLSFSHEKQEEQIKSRVSNRIEITNQ